jgi:xylan 1,4-beta-xylosidase
VQIHHSRDLISWQLIARPLNRLSQLDMRGNPDSGGVWAPCLSYDKGVFYLVYSNVRSFQGVWKDTPNYLVTTENIRGEWTDPVFLSSIGFDASLFHDDDGRKWYLSTLIDHRKAKLFGGITLQEYDVGKQCLTGSSRLIFEGSELGVTEGPHLYKYRGWYYLLTAEGGTAYEHAVSLARSRSINGPYELHPDNPVVTSSNNPQAYLQKTGHGDLVETADGQWFLVCLASRPLQTRGRCTLGRETIIMPVSWSNDDWLYLETEGRTAPTTVQLHTHQLIEKSIETFKRDDFDRPELNIHFQSLRIPISERWLSLSARPGYLRLYGRESLSSLHYQSLLARRVQAFHIQAATALDFCPQNFQQMAGLVCYYNTYHWFYLHVLGDEEGQRWLQITSCDKYKIQEELGEGILLPKEGVIYLKVDFNWADLQFYYSTSSENWMPVGPVLDGSILSDDYVCDAGNRYRPAFTGAFVGLACQDLSGQGHHADFDWWEYSEVIDSLPG